MKTRNLIATALLALPLAAQAQATIDGYVENMKADKIYLSIRGEAVDSSAVIDGRFHLESTVPDVNYCMLYTPDYQWGAQFWLTPTDKVKITTAKQFLAEGKETEALYVLWHLPAGEETDVLKFRYAAKENPWVAQGLYKELDARYKGTEAYQTFMRRVAEIILKENLSDFYYDAWQTLKYFSDHGQWGRENSDEIQLLIGLLQHRYASSLQRSAAFRLKSSKGTLTDEVLQKEIESILNSQPDKQ